MQTSEYPAVKPFHSESVVQPQANTTPKAKPDRTGWLWAAASPLFLGTTPIIAKAAYSYGVDVITVAAFRTLMAALLLWLFALMFGRRFVVSSLPAALSSFLAGVINGIGSIFFYASLTLIDASLGQLINITYLIFVTALLRLIGQRVSRLTLGRIALAIGAIYLLTSGGVQAPNWLGVGFMLIGAFSYALQLVLSQRIMADIPAPTMALYAMTGMAVVVTAVWFLYRPAIDLIPAAGWHAVAWMGVVTALARLTLFMGVKRLGSMQTALVGIAEVIVSILLAAGFLGERLTAVQWIGACILLLSVLLAKYERDVPRFDWWAIIYRRFSQSQS